MISKKVKVKERVSAQKEANAERIAKVLSECETAGMKKAERYAALIQIPKMTKTRAKELAGYSPRSHNSIDKRKGVQKAIETIETQRERLQRTKGYRLEDSAKFYQGKSVKAKQDSDAIRARTRLDDVLGYNAPMKVEIEERREITMAIQVLQDITNRTGLTPLELKRALSSIEQAEMVPVQIPSRTENIKQPVLQGYVGYHLD